MALVPVTVYGSSFTSNEATFLKNFADLTVVQGDIYYVNNTGQVAVLAPGNNGNVLTSGGANANPSWTAVSGTGTVTTVSVVSTNGFTGTVANATTTPAITLTTSITGTLQGNGTAISASKVTLTQPASGSTLTIVDGKTLTVNNSITLTGTDTTTMTFPTTSATIARTDVGQTFTGTNVFGVITATTLNGNTFTTGTYTLTGTAGKTLNFTNSLTLTGTDATTMTFPTTSATIARTDVGQTFTGTNVFGVITATTLNGNTFTTGTYTLTGQAGKTLTFNGTITLTGTDAQTYTFPTTTATIARIDAANTFVGTQTITTIAGLTTVTGAASNMTITAGTGNSRTMILQTTTSGGAATTSLTLNADQTATFAAGITVGGTLALGANSITMSGSIGVTGTRITKGWFTDIESTNVPTVGGTALPTLAANQTWTGQDKFNNIVDVNNAVTVTTNAGTVPVTFRLNTFTNSSAATMAITMATASAVDGQMTIVRIYDFSAVAQTIGWTNTENSTVSVPTTSNGSTTLPLTCGFMYNSATSKWRCVASA